MSDPVTNVEIEDVLTSIRRLVSENGKGGTPTDRTASLRADPTPEPQPVEEEAAEIEEIEEEVAEIEEAASTRLMLTPALRVLEPEQDDADDGEASDPEGESAFAFDESPVQDEQDEVIEEEAAIDQDELDEIDFSDEDFRHFVKDYEEGPDAENDPLSQSDENLALDEEDDDEDENDFDFVNEEKANFDPDEGIALSEAQSLDARIVQWENVSANDDEPYEPDAPGDSDYAGTDVSSLSWIEAVTAKHKSNADPEPAEEELQETPETAEEASVTSYVVEEEAESLDPYAEITQQAEEEAADYVYETVEKTIAPELEGADLDESLTLDEAMLREMVSDIVRQELQGSLGERITRNVRKLVRREIHRALAAHDLE